MNRRFIAVAAAGALIAAGVPALAMSARAPLPAALARAVSLPGLGFTPASANPRLAALLPKGALGESRYAFTPSAPRHLGNRIAALGTGARGEFVVSVQPSSVDGDSGARARQPLSGLAPISYSLDRATPARPAPGADTSIRFDLAQIGHTSEPLEFTPASQPATRAPARVRALTTPTPGFTGSRISGEPAPGLLDVGGSYRINRHVDLTAGLRYKSNDYRLDRPDNRQDSQSVFIGTALRF